MKPFFMELSKIKEYFANPRSRDVVFADAKGDYLLIKKGAFCNEVRKSDIGKEATPQVEENFNHKKFKKK